MHRKVKERTAFELNELVIQNNYHLTTGFVGTPYLCFALSKGGYHETAVRLLMQDDYPSWLYSVKKGATTIWEHWDGIKQDGSFWSDEMNSFNHYAYGAIGNWMYKVLAGLDMNEVFPAYKKIRIEPKFAGIHLTHAKASYESMYGRIRSSWRLTEEEIEIEVDIPANTSAEIILPNTHSKDVLESGKSLESTAGIYSFNETINGVILSVGSGKYRFKYLNERGLRPIFTEETRLLDLLQHEEIVEILIKYAPGITKFPGVLEMRTKSLKELADLQKAKLSTDKVNAFLEELNKIEWNLVSAK